MYTGAFWTSSRSARSAVAALLDKIEALLRVRGGTRDGGAAARGLWPEGQDQRVINLNRVGAIDGNSRLVELRHRSSDSEVNTVFNVAQCDGLPEKIIKGSFEDAPKNPDETRQECDAFVKATEATIKHQGEKACYNPVSR